MNNKDFRQHFINACKHLEIEKFESRSYLVCPIIENGKHYSSVDDIMRLCLIPKQRICNLEQLINLFTWKEGFYPLWIRLFAEDKVIVVNTSLRMRKAGSRDDKLFYPFVVEKRG